jgi:hypothetical protein
MKRTLTARMTLLSGAAALALGAAACDVEDTGTDEPIENDVVEEDLLEDEDL